MLVVLEEYAACRLLLLERERGVGEIDEDPREITYSMFLLIKKLLKVCAALLLAAAHLVHLVLLLGPLLELLAALRVNPLALRVPRILRRKEE